MKSTKMIPQKWTWTELVPYIEPSPCILLNGPADDFILGWDFGNEYSAAQGTFDFSALEDFVDGHRNTYIFGYLSYDVKNSIEPFLKSENNDIMNFPDAHFVVPKNVIVRRNNSISYYGSLTNEELTGFFSGPVAPPVAPGTGISLQARTGPEDYIKNFNGIKEAIQFGTIYEMNYCLNFFSTGEKIHPFATYQKLNAGTCAPFSCYLHFGNHYALCASPERYIKKTGNYLLSQPIKGTAARGISENDDELQKKQLAADPKERAENIMIVDLVRNDLSRVAAKDSVSVEELCGVHTFKTVHQLVSSISCTLKDKTTFSDVIRATFPMGSMTGAPKISAMEQIEKYENFRRGLYSGTIGYIDPNGDFDFNVVIRSILYNSNPDVVSCSVGGAITINADAQKEYDECLLKLSALKKALC